MSTLATSFHDHSVDISIQLLDTVTADYPRHDFAVRFWNGEVWGNAESSRFTLLLKHPGALRRMLLGANELTLGEAFIFDDFDIEGDLEAAFALGDYLVAHELELLEKVRLAGLLLRLPHNGHNGNHLTPHLIGSPHPNSVTARPSPITTISPTISTRCGSIVAWCIRAPISSQARKTSTPHRLTSWTTSAASSDCVRESGCSMLAAVGEASFYMLPGTSASGLGGSPSASRRRSWRESALKRPD